MTNKISETGGTAEADDAIETSKLLTLFKPIRFWNTSSNLMGETVMSNETAGILGKSLNNRVGFAIYITFKPAIM